MKGGHRMVSLMQSNQGNMQKKLINTQENGLLDTFHTATFTCSLSKGLTEHSLQPVAMHKITSSSHPQLCPLLSPLLTSAVPLWFSQKWCEQIRWLAGPIFISGKTCKLVSWLQDYDCVFQRRTWDTRILQMSQVLSMIMKLCNK